jgi:hypothetical protein
MISNISLPKIDKITPELEKIKDDNILLKYTCKGINFMKINRNDILKLNELNKLKLFNTFYTFTQPMYETLLEGLPTKFYLDLDFKNIPCSIYNNKNNILIEVDNYLRKFLEKKNIFYTNIIYTDASRMVIKNNEKKYKLSFHVVINGFGFRNRNILKNLVLEFIESIDNELIKTAVDDSVYKIPQLFKCIMSPANDKNTKLINVIIENNDVKYLDIDENKILDYLSGIYDDKCIYLDENFKHLDIETKKKNGKISKNLENCQQITRNYMEIPQNTINWIYNHQLISGIYIIKKNNLINNKIDLKRMTSAFCKVCKRLHENENAYILHKNNNLYFHCGRNTSIGKYIGKLNIDNKKQNNVLEETIEKLRKYIIELEEKLEKINKTYTVNIVKKNMEKKDKVIIYSKNPDEGMWNKYYELGKFLTAGFNEMVDKIVCHWKDGNLSRLKSRSLRIYKYLNKYRNNECNYSLRKIFNLKNIEFNKIMT